MSHSSKQIPESQGLFRPIPQLTSRFQRRTIPSEPIKIGLQLYSVQKLQRDCQVKMISESNMKRTLSQDVFLSCESFKKYLTKNELISGSLNPFTQDPKFLELSSTLTDEDNETFLQQIEMFDD